MSSAEMVWDKKDRIRHTGQSETIKTKKIQSGTGRINQTGHRQYNMNCNKTERTK